MVWNLVAPILAAAPTGTIAKVDREAFSLRQRMALWRYFCPKTSAQRPSDFDGIGDEEFAKLQSTLEQWVAATAYDTACTPSHFTDVLAATY
jgi:hypothetical protein